MKNCNSMKFLISFLFILLFSSCTKKLEIEQDIPIVEESPVLDESVKASIPHVYINIANNAEVVEKETYLNAEIYIEGNEEFQKLEVQSTRIRGRGNSTWVLPKKPYRLKLDNKSSIFGLPAAKDWILLANYNDYTLMTNAVAMNIGKQLGMPFTNDIIAVDLTVNGVYRGNYNLTQQIEVKEGRVDIGDDGVLWELDSYFDEDRKFRSTHYNLPVMLKDPDPDSDGQFEAWKSDFQNFENMLVANSFPNNSYANVFDKQQFVNFLIVNFLVGNHEVNHPKSIFMHKRLGGKYTMGPIWDFDFAFGFSEENSRTYFNYVDMSIIVNNENSIGGIFYNRLLQDPEIKLLFVKTWNDYKSKKFDNLMQFIENYASKIRESQKKDYLKWRVGNNNHAQNKASMKTFLRKRVSLIDAFIKKI